MHTFFQRFQSLEKEFELLDIKENGLIDENMDNCDYTTENNKKNSVSYHCVYSEYPEWLTV